MGVCLALVARVNLDVGIIVGPFLVFVALKDFSPRVGAMVRSLTRNERTYLVVMGVVHGLTNLGGSLLTALVHAKGYANDPTRVTVAIGYCTFAVFQIITLAFTARKLSIDYEAHAVYVAVGVVVFVLVDRLLYAKLDDRKYRRLFAAFLLASGCLLTYKAIVRVIPAGPSFHVRPSSFGAGYEADVWTGP